jgi:hypothetical protein
MLGQLFLPGPAGLAVFTLCGWISCSHLSTGKAEGEAQRQLLLNVPLVHEAESREFPAGFCRLTNLHGQYRQILE